MNWYVRVKGNEFDLKCLSNYINNEEVCLELEDGNKSQYILKSDKFRELNEDYDVFKKAKEIIEYINGIGNLIIDFYRNIECAEVIRVNKDGTKAVNSFLPISIQMGKSYMSAKGTVIENEIEFEVLIKENLFKLIEKDKSVKHLIRHISSGLDNWINLYRILEHIEGDLGKRKDVSDKGWISKKKENFSSILQIVYLY